MIVWRIGTDTPTYQADDMSGMGAQKTGGRWNRQGLPVVYAADSPSLACLETLVHLGISLPFNRYLVAIDIPDPVWNARVIGNPPVGWDALPAGMVSLDYGDAWLKSNQSAVMELCSAIVPEDKIILINPAHPDTKSIAATKMRKWLYDPRLKA